MRAFAEKEKTSRFAALAIEHGEIDADVEAHPFSRLTSAELSEYEPPDAYAEGIRRLQEERR